MQNLDIQDYASKITLVLPDTAVRRLVLPYIIGMAIGNFLAVKQGNELSPMTAYADAHAGNVSRAVSKINEEVMIDVQVAMDAARNQYLLRSRILNGDCVDYRVSPEFDFMAVAMGISATMPLEIYTALKGTGLGASTAYSMSNLLISKLKEAKLILN